MANFSGSPYTCSMGELGEWGYGETVKSLKEHKKQRDAVLMNVITIQKSRMLTKAGYPCVGKYWSKNHTRWVFVHISGIKRIRKPRQKVAKIKK